MQTGKSIWSNERPTQWIWGWRQLQREKNWWASPRDTRKPSWRKNLKTLQKPRNNGLNGWHDVACLLDLWLWSKGVRTDPLGAHFIVQEWHKELGALKWKLLVTTFPNWVHRRQRHWRSWKKRKSWGPVKEIRRQNGSGWQVMLVSAGKAANLLSIRLVMSFVALMRGWIWGSHGALREREHINLLELRAILRGLQWRARTKRFCSCRFLHFADSQICLVVLCKGRPSSRKINRILRKICAQCIALNLYPLWVWVASRLNPADEPSRRYEWVRRKQKYPKKAHGQQDK